MVYLCYDDTMTDEKGTEDDAVELIMNPYWRLTNLYWIRTKMAGHEGKTVVFTPNRVQKKIYQAIEDGWNRVIILKPRKLGITTAVSLYLLDKAMYSPNQLCRTIAHRKQTVTELFNDIARFAFDRIPKELRPEEKYTTRAELEFKGTGSKYSIDVEARGMTPTFLHFSEIAYVDDEGKLEDTLESLPRTAVGIAESTANGKGNWFERTFMDNWQAMQDGHRPEWYPMFFAWFEDPNNAMPFPTDTEFFYPDDVEKQRSSYKNPDDSELTDEQLLWWDRKKFQLGDRLPELYPSTPEEAFIFSTGRVYPEFIEGLHVISPRQYDNFFVAMDYGQTNPTVFLLIHQDNDGNFIVFDEFYESECAIEDSTHWLKKKGIRKVHYPDPSIFYKTQVKAKIKGGEMGDHRYAISDEFQRHGITLLRGAQNDIPAGLVRVKEYLRFDPDRPHPFNRDQFGDPKKGSPRLFITENCEKTIGEMYLYRWPKDPSGALNKEKYEVPVKEHDHALDCIRYCLLSRGKPLGGREDEPTPRTPKWFLWNRQRKGRQKAVVSY